MQQSNAIFAFVFIAFLFFITARGKLRKYMGFLLSNPIEPASGPSSAFGNSAFNPGNLFGTAVGSIFGK